MDPNSSVAHTFPANTNISAYLEQFHDVARADTRRLLVSCKSGARRGVFHVESPWTAVGSSRGLCSQTNSVHIYINTKELVKFGFCSLADLILCVQLIRNHGSLRVHNCESVERQQWFRHISVISWDKEKRSEKRSYPRRG